MGAARWTASIEGRPTHGLKIGQHAFSVLEPMRPGMHLKAGADGMVGAAAPARRSARWAAVALRPQPTWRECQIASVDVGRSRLAPPVSTISCAELDDASHHLPRLHISEALVDVGELDTVGDPVVEMQLTLVVELD